MNYQQWPAMIGEDYIICRGFQVRPTMEPLTAFTTHPLRCVAEEVLVTFNCNPLSPRAVISTNLRACLLMGDYLL